MGTKYKVGDRFVNTTNDLKVEIIEIRENDDPYIKYEYGILALDGNPKSFRNFEWHTEFWLNRVLKHQIYLTT